MARIVFVMIFVVFQLTLRTVHSGREVQVGIKSHSTDHLENSAVRFAGENKSVSSPLKLFMHNMTLPLRRNTRPRNEMDSTDVVRKVVKQDQITSHTVHKRSPGCLMWCLKKRILHPTQCHSYCTSSG